MKIEMGESLVLSWLKHIKMCHIVQTNWKPSPEWIPYRRELVEQLEKYTSEYFLKLGYDLFKKNNSDQVQKQAEIDVLGLTFAGDEKKIYAVDIAFHKAGLGYGGTSENITRVLKKCIRTMMSLIQYFDVTTGHIVFASPKINPKDYQKLQEEFAKIDEIVDLFGLHFTFELISNEEFNTHIIQPVFALSGKVSDTTELFLRSVQLLDMCDIYRKPEKQIKDHEVHLANNKTTAEERDFVNIKGVKIFTERVENQSRKYFLEVLPQLLSILPEDEIAKLQTISYSDKLGLTGHINQYPVISKDKNQMYTKDGRFRAYTSKIGDFWLSAQWFERQLNAWKKYLRYLEHTLN